MDTMRIHDNRVRICTGMEELSLVAAQLFVKAAQNAVASAGRFAVVLSGGHTPELTYRLLGQEPCRGRVNWQETHVFWGDERCVPRDDARNNAAMAFETLLDHVPIPRSHVHPIATEKSPEHAADHYEKLLREFFRDLPARFDLVFLGLGDNGHTASLFPHTPILDEQDRWVKEVYLAEQHMYRVSLTAPIINQAATVAFLVSGRNKSRVLRQVLLEPPRPQELPAQLIHPTDGDVVWLVDEDAAADLPRQADAH
jgi:6-phosphogluconolactonase